ncbi:putative cysteine-rich receptor-like protein kinase 32 [Capsicum annuum]|uniref:putative cysteine-rich receptor-like protein kinase 32 n=1 Tax=Capsicum annuum TaxID=4072 RepID=UPI0007BED07A|nr:putative cysteine-rich receptor-like protein kinase 32 [Capsicum annuum]
MTPKISDFGLAREFKYDVEVKTRRVAGTHGYMPPEYIENGYYSTKSDVFSFGVLALEIVSGERNSTYQHPIYDIGLVGYAWRIWEEGKPIELLDPEIEKQAIGADTYTLLEDSRAVEAIRWDESWLRVDFRSLGVDIVLFVVVDGFDGFRSETGHG